MLKKKKTQSELSQLVVQRQAKAKSTKTQSKSDWNRLKKMKDSGIDFSDIPEISEEFFKTAKVIYPEPKTAVSIRLDKDVLEWFKGQGRGYQSKINAVLKTYVKAHAH